MKNLLRWLLTLGRLLAAYFHEKFRCALPCETAELVKTQKGEQPMKQTFSLVRNCRRCEKPFAIHNPRSYYCPDCHRGICMVCGKEFSMTNYFKQETCSSSCASKLASQRHRPRTSLNCQWCGKFFYPPSGKLKTKFCSLKCRYDSKKKPDPEIKRAGWKYRAWRKTVLERDHRTCQECGSTKKVGAHHVKAWKDYPDLRYDISNGVSLCEFCHANAHGASVPRVQKKFDPICTLCGKATKGRARLCKSCSMKTSPKSQAWRNRRARDNKGKFA